MNTQSTQQSAGGSAATIWFVVAWLFSVAAVVAYLLATSDVPRLAANYVPTIVLAAGAAVAVVVGAIFAASRRD